MSLKLAAKLVASAWVGTMLALGAPCAVAQTSPANVTVTLGSDGYFYLLHYITEGAGFYKAEGITVEVVRFSSGSKIIASVLGGSADASMVNIGNTTLAIQKGGDLATLATLYTIMPFAVVLSNDALKKTGITPAMPLDERVKRLQGLRIATTGPGSGTDQFIRTLFVARGMNPDKEVTLQTLGDGGTMLAAMEAKAIDGFVLGSPVTNQAVQKGLGKIAISGISGEVPEFNGLTYLGLIASREAIEKKGPVLMKTVRALTRGMKFVRDNPAETRRIARAHFSDIDEATFNETYGEHLKGIPESPVLTPEQYQQTLKAYFFGTKTQLTVPYEKAVASDFARQAQRDILGR
jgi:NitT/TauT family transport system substrate-binding protein